MLTPRSRPTTTLIAPVRVSNILITNENIIYNERKHWASLLSTFVETISLLTFITLMAGGLPSGLFGASLFALAAVIAAIMVLSEKWKKWPVIVGAVLIAAGLYVPSLFGLVAMAVIYTAGRFIYRFAMWAFYERLIITNRRLIFASGFFGSEIAMMPLTRITDISYKRPAIADLLGYGQLRVETAGQHQALGFIDHINHPNEFYEMLINRSTTAVGAGPDKGKPDDKPPSPTKGVPPRSGPESATMRMPALARVDQDADDGDDNNDEDDGTGNPPDPSRRRRRSRDIPFGRDDA